jgi:hypothetical protein
MSDISPLQRLLLRILRNGSLGAAGLMLIFLVINIWQETKASGFESLDRQDWSFIGLLAVMLLGAIWLYRAIGREMNNPGA